MSQAISRGWRPSACASRLKVTSMEPSLCRAAVPRITAALERLANSAGPIGMIADKTARRAGDLLTVVIAEAQDISNEESANLTKSTTLEYALDSFNIKPNAFNPLPDIEATSQDDFNGTANYEKKGTFSARITAIVMDVLPNGNLVIQGRREVRVDGEVKVLEFSGIVRRYDVSRTNSIESE